MTTLNLETEVQSPNAMFLRTQILSGSGEGVKFDLDQIGTTVILRVTRDGETIGHETLSLRALTEQWVSKILEKTA